MRLVTTDGTTLLVLGPGAQITAGKRPQLFVRLPVALWMRISRAGGCRVLEKGVSRSAVLLKNYDARSEIARFDLGPREI